MKKLISMLLTLCIVVSICSVSVVSFNASEVVKSKDGLWSYFVDKGNLKVHRDPITGGMVADGYYEDMPLGPTDQYAKIIGNIHDNAWNEDRDITKREKERCDEIEEQISDLENCVKHIENAMECLEYYTD